MPRESLEIIILLLFFVIDSMQDKISISRATLRLAEQKEH